MDFPILINWTSPFFIEGVFGVLFHLYQIPVSKQCSPWSDAAYDLGLPCLPMSQKWDARLVCIKSYKS